MLAYSFFRTAANLALISFATIVSLPAQDSKPADTPANKDKDKKPALSLKPDRKIEFTTDEGTWLSLDISPDGKTILFELLGDLYILPIAGGEAKPLLTGDEDVITDELGSAFRPLLSHDGKKLIYGTRFETETGLKIRDLQTGDEHWLKYPIQRDDQESIGSRDVLPGYAFTPDDQAIILNYGGKIHRVDVSSGVDAVIPFQAKVSQELGPKLSFPIRVDQSPLKVRLIQGPQQSPDGKEVAFSALTHLYVSPLPATGSPKRLTTADAREYQPTWSPDGQWIAYVTWTAAGGHIWKTRADGAGMPTQLTRTSAFYRDPAWSPDGTKIVALRTSTENRNEMEVEFDEPIGMDVIWIPASGGDATLIAPARGSGQPHFVTNEPDRVYVYSPGGLISMRYDGTDKRTLLKVVGKNREFTPEPPAADDVRINPDGQTAIALVSSQLWVLAVPRTGETPQVDVSAPSIPTRKLTRIGADYMGWSRDGKDIYWGLGASFFRQPLSTVTYEEPEKKDDGLRQKRGNTPSPHLPKSSTRSSPSPLKSRATNPPVRSSYAAPKPSP